jgi:D-beta-D-heptose 7-phosphate kinase/D-beta-D-heptose 1-phosphate adenosyltransferase
LTGSKIRSWENAVSWRRTISGPFVFTNGVFDLLHAGHVMLLEEAGRLGEALCVGVNTDHSARGLQKGPGRPIHPAAARARVVAGLASVGGVVLFDEPTPSELIERLEPDVLVKGSDYDPDQLPGGAFVRMRGGRVVCLPLVPDFSTTAIVERIRDTP